MDEDQSKIKAVLAQTDTFLQFSRQQESVCTKQWMDFLADYEKAQEANKQRHEELVAAVKEAEQNLLNGQGALDACVKAYDLKLNHEKAMRASEDRFQQYKTARDLQCNLIQEKFKKLQSAINRQHIAQAWVNQIGRFQVDAPNKVWLMEIKATSAITGRMVRLTTTKPKTADYDYSIDHQSGMSAVEGGAFIGWESLRGRLTNASVDADIWKDKCHTSGNFVPWLPYVDQIALIGAYFDTYILDDSS